MNIKTKFYITQYINELIYRLIKTEGLLGGALVKNPLANAGHSRDMGLIPGSGRSPRVGNGNPL